MEEFWLHFIGSPSTKFLEYIDYSIQLNTTNSIDSDLYWAVLSRSPYKRRYRGPHWKIDRQNRFTSCGMNWQKQTLAEAGVNLIGLGLFMYEAQKRSSGSRKCFSLTTPPKHSIFFWFVQKSNEPCTCSAHSDDFVLEQIRVPIKLLMYHYTVRITNRLSIASSAKKNLLLSSSWSISYGWGFSMPALYTVEWNLS